MADSRAAFLLFFRVLFIFGRLSRRDAVRLGRGRGRAGPGRAGPGAHSQRVVLRCAVIIVIAGDSADKAGTVCSPPPHFYLYPHTAS